MLCTKKVVSEDNEHYFNVRRYWLATSEATIALSYHEGAYMLRNSVASLR